MDDRPVWAQRLQQARQAKFATTWLAARALHRLDPQHLPDGRALHRYWTERWESGRIRPNRTYRELIQLLLKAPGLFGDPAFSEYPTPLPCEPAEAIPAQPAEPVQPVQHGEPVQADSATLSTTPFRPNSLMHGEFPSTGELGRVIIMAADDAARDAADLGAGHAERTLEQLHDDVLRVARGYALRPLPDVFLDARRIREFAVELAGRTRRSDQLADLNTVAGQACGLLSVAAFDMGYWDASARFADSSVSYGELAGHDSLRSWAMGMQGFMANWMGRPTDAANYLAAAMEIAPAGTATARLRAYQARSLALLGDREGVVEAARVAEIAREVDVRDEMHDEVGGEFTFAHPRQELSLGTSYVALGDGPRAEAHALRALDLYAALPPEQRPYYDENAARVDLASARIMRGDLAGARAALEPVFALPPVQRSAGITSRLDQVRALLAVDLFRNSREAAQLTTDITDFTADTTPRALPPGDL